MLMARPRVGVLALQGAFAEHEAALRDVGAEAVEVRKPDELAAVDALIIPGGESTTIGKLLVDFDLLEPLRQRIAAGLPVWGTCAGAILLARAATGGEPPLLRVMDIEVERNAFGRQVQSFETELEIPAVGPEPVPAVFIRAPAITRVWGRARALARLPDGRIAAAEQDRLLATAFHPELTADRRLHRYFLGLLERTGENGRCSPRRRPPAVPRRPRPEPHAARMRGAAE
jgi:5'-phosphate synthase pdxT subunit